MPRARRSPRAWGIVPSFVDTEGVWRRPSARAVTAALDAMGADAVAPPGEPSLVLAPGEAAELATPAEAVLEDGTRLPAALRLPPDLPLGVHHLEPLDGGVHRAVIVAPLHCHRPPGLRTGGLAVQLYAARSWGSWGIGDLADLRSLGRWAAALGAGVVLVNPLHAPLPFLPQQDSPYSPSSRRYRAPLALRIEEVDGYLEADDPSLDALAVAGRALNAERLIDRDAVHRLKLAALERLHARFDGSPAFDTYRHQPGEALRLFATHNALAEEFGRTWPAWPDELRHPTAPAVARWAGRHAERVEFHAWVQWQIDKQLAAASRATPVMHDLAVGVDPAGADAWIDQDTLVSGVRIGAPPDEFNAAGQDWGLPPFDPWRLRAAGFAPFRDPVRAGLRHAGALRLDHVMGLFRLWWITPGADPGDGVYVRYPSEELLAVLALESHRAGALIVGEDLGTVGHGVRSALARRGLLAYRVLWFEDRPASALPRGVMAAVTTHDLPTVAGLWRGGDAAEQRRLGNDADADATDARRARIAVATGVPVEADAAAVAERLHDDLAASPAAIVTVTLDDLALVEERPNLPGVGGTRPNWRLALPGPLEDLMENDFARRLAALVARRGRS